MKAIWDRIHTWLAANAPDVLAGLRPGATDEQLRDAEEQMDLALPDDVKDAYRIHDGGELPFLYAWEWLSVAGMVSTWRMHRELLDGGKFGDNEGRSVHEAIQGVWWHPSWVPVTNSSYGHCHCVDLAPTGRGWVGQVIHWCHDDSDRYFQARSFNEWLEQFADQLEAGEWTNAPPDYLPGLLRVDEL